MCLSMTLVLNPTTTPILTPTSFFMNRGCLFHLIVIEPTFWSSMYFEISTLPPKYMTQNIFSLGKKLHQYQSLHNYHYQLYFCYNQRNIETKSNSIYVFLEILFYGSSSSHLSTAVAWRKKKNPNILQIIVPNAHF